MMSVVSGPRVVRLGSVRSFAEFGDDLETGVGVGHDFEGGVGVPVRDRELGGLGTDVLVLRHRQLDAIVALQVGALAQKRNRALGGSPPDGGVLNPFVDLSEEALVLGPANVTVHGTENASP